LSNVIELLPDAHQIAVGSRHQDLEHLHHIDSRAEGRIDGCHLEPDDAATDDQHPLRHLRQFECAGRVDDPRIIGKER
jgi:hypothetical protein